MNSFEDLVISQKLKSCELVPQKIILIFPSNFLYFRSYSIEKQGIINLSSYSSWSHASTVLSDSEVTFIGEEEDVAFPPFVYYVFFYTQHCVIEETGRKISVCSVFIEDLFLK